PVLQKALNWSKAVNASINLLPEELKKPFTGAKEGLAAASEVADVAIVSSANRDAVVEEWSKFGLLEHTDITLAQDVGSKAACIAAMLKFGYAPDHVLMVGDAPGDCEAAEKNGVWYYPILVRNETESWDDLREKFLPVFLAGDYSFVQEALKKRFLENLGGN
ncbi:MAG: HAD hydrolase-like protein, partial [Oscillospiraceae bacterium]|nr:HAD hydrolase-like protein [Oscillospiraceae bacterium]